MERTKNTLVVIFVSWIMIQLVILGAVGADLCNEVAAKTYDCNEMKLHVPVLLGVIFPLAVFAPPPTGIEEFCKGK